MRLSDRWESGLWAAISVGLILGGVGVWACSVPPSRETTDLQYLHDARTDLCFATRFGASRVASYVMVLVPCSPAVRAVIQEVR